MELNPLLMLNMISFAFNFTLAVYVVVSNRQTTKEKDFQEVKNQVLTIAATIKSMPDHKALAEIEADLREVKANINGMTKQMDLMQKSVTRIETHMIDKGK